MTRRNLVALALIAYLVFLLDIALLRFPADKPKVNFVPFRTIVQDCSHRGWMFVINFVGNIVAFVPMGLLPPHIRKRQTTLWQVLVFSLLLSLFIEIGQFVSGRRVPDVDDLILNTFGGGLGYFLSLTVRPLSPQTSIARQPRK